METSAEVAAWGEQWAHDFVENGGPPQDREQREWLIDGWRLWTLETWAHCKQEERRLSGGMDHDEFNATFAANNHLRLYPRERIGLLVWRAYSEYRHAGLPVPEDILTKLDQWAQRLESAHNAEAVAQAIDMGSRGYGGSAVKHLNKVEATRHIVSEVAQLLNLRRGRISNEEVFRQVARRHGKSSGNVKKMWQRWIKAEEEWLASSSEQRQRPKKQTVKPMGPRSVFDLGQKVSK